MSMMIKSKKERDDQVFKTRKYDDYGTLDLRNQVSSTKLYWPEFKTKTYRERDFNAEPESFFKPELKERKNDRYSALPVITALSLFSGSKNDKYRNSEEKMNSKENFHLKIKQSRPKLTVDNTFNLLDEKTGLLKTLSTTKTASASKGSKTGGDTLKTANILPSFLPQPKDIKVPDEKINKIIPKYQRCCCGIAVTTATQLICFQLIFISLFSAIFGGIFSLHFVFAAIISFICLLPIYGIYKKQPEWLIPFFILPVIGLTFFSLSVLSLIFTGKDLRINVLENELPYDDNTYRYLLIFLVLRNAISLWLSLWYLMIVLKCYHYLLECKDQRISKVAFV